jgi:tryptophan halogenase
MLELFPDRNFDQAGIDEFNRIMNLEYERVRDFVMLHYHATSRDDSPMWNYVRTMEIPDSLAYKMHLWRERGHVVKYKDGMFLKPSWHAVYVGQRVIPKRYDPRVDNIELDELRRGMARVRDAVDKAADSMPSHQSFLNGEGRMNPTPEAKA